MGNFRPLERLRFDAGYTHHQAREYGTIVSLHAIKKVALNLLAFWPAAGRIINPKMLNHLFIAQFSETSTFVHFLPVFFLAVNITVADKMTC